MSYKLDYSIESKIPAKLDYLRAKGGESGGGGGTPTYETLREFSVGEGADHVYAFTSNETKYDDSVGGNDLVTSDGRPAPSWSNGTVHQVSGGEGYLHFNSIDGARQETSQGMRMDRTTDLTFALVFQLTNTTDYSGQILGVDAPAFSGGNQYIPFEIWSFAHKLAISTPNSLTNYQTRSIGTGSNQIGANMTVALVARYIASEDKVSWRMRFPGYVYGNDFQPSSSRDLRKEDGNFVIYPYDNGHGVSPRSASVGSTAKLGFGSHDSEINTRDMRLWHVGIWLNEALTDEQADAFFDIAGV